VPSSGAITASIGLLFVLSIVVNFLPQSWQDHVDKWMPAIAGTMIWTTRPDPSLLSPWTGFAVLCGWAALAHLSENDIILGVDGQSIGGYPQVAQVAAADLDAVGQLRPGERVRFERVDLGEAERLERRRRKALAGWLTRLRETFPR